MIKKFFVTVCSICLILSIVGCSNTDVATNSDNNISANQSVENNQVVDFDLYDFAFAGALGNTYISIAGEGNFTSDNTYRIPVWIGYGNAPSPGYTFDSENLVFYIFESEEVANTAFEYVKTNIVQEDADITENYICGLDKNSVNITIKHFYYINRNMIIYHLDYMGDPGFDDNESETSIATNNQLHTDIMENWNY